MLHSLAVAGGRFFDFMGLASGSEAQYKKYKQHEITNGRLAMTAAVGEQR